MLRDTYKGRRLLVKRAPAWGLLDTFVNGQMHGRTTGHGREAEARELESLRRWVDFADEKRKADPSAFPAYWYEGAP